MAVMALEPSVIRTWRYGRSYVGSAVEARCSLQLDVPPRLLAASWSSAKAATAARAAPAAVDQLAQPAGHSPGVEDGVESSIDTKKQESHTLL